MTVPTDVAGLHTWYDFSTLGLSDGASVSSVSDLSGGGHTASQATGSKQPIYRTGVAISGLGAAQWDGTNARSLNATGVTLTQPDTIFIAAKVSSSSAGDYRHLVDGITAGTGRQILRLGIAGANWEIYAGTVLSGGTGDTNWHVFTAVYNGASSSLRIDGTGVISGSGGTQGTSGGIRIGINNDDASGMLDGYIGEMVFYNASVSTTDRDGLETYLHNKWLEVPVPSLWGVVSGGHRIG